MSEADRIVDQLTRAFEGEAWHGPAVLEILNQTSAQQATMRPIKGAHTIWETALHITAWLRACRRRLDGDRAQLNDAEDWPAVTVSSDEAWRDVSTTMKQALDELRAAISSLDDSRLDQPIIEGMSSVYITLHGVIQHSLYHAGQMAILKKNAEEV
ncbi:MAG TPA: DinB family protein [Pyrinomonadaceae bacterium]|jgi:uncharacterized damage-inducible protein DinB